MNWRNEMRNAILKAADSIEQNPELFNFESAKVPDCGTPGCAIGWIALHSGKGKGEYWNDFAVLGGAPQAGGEQTFYSRMTDITSSFTTWAYDAESCAKTLRIYADKYHPEEKAIPDSVLELFDADKIREKSYKRFKNELRSSG